MVGKLNRGGTFDKLQVAPQSRDWKAYGEGYRAHVYLKPSTANPYLTLPLSGRWDQGWADAQAGIYNPMLPERGVPRVEE